MIAHKKRSLWLVVIFFLYILFIVVFILISLFFKYSLKKRIKDVVVVEYKSNLNISDFMNNYLDTDEIRIDGNINDYQEIGNYKVKIIVNNILFKVDLIVQDSMGPNLEVRDLEVYLDEEMPSVNDFVVDCYDVSNYKIEDINYEKKIGNQILDIKAIDEYGNETIKQVNLLIKEDSEAPVITGLNDITMFIGEKIDLKEGVKAIDSRFGDVSFWVDDSNVNYKKEGTYKIIYEAVDNLGNRRKEERNIVIKMPDVTYMIDNFPVYKQYPMYPNGCESVALYNLLKYYKVNVEVEDIVDKLKKGDKPYKEGDKLYGGDPEIEFVGDPRDIHGYGVYQKPIIEVAKEFKKGIIDYTNHSLDEVLELVKRNIPVQVWVSINLRDTSVCTYWMNKDTNKKIEWLCDLHSVVIVGYNSREVIVSDSYVGDIVKYDREQFNKIFNLFGRRAIYYEN